MRFRFYKGMRVPYNRQGLIFFTCLNYSTQPEETKKMIRELAREVGREYEDALFALLTTDRSITMIACDYYTSANTLYRLKKDFYERWDKEKKDTRL